MILNKALNFIGFFTLTICLLAAGDVFNFVGKLQQFLVWVMK